MAQIVLFSLFKKEQKLVQIRAVTFYRMGRKILVLQMDEKRADPFFHAALRRRYLPSFAAVLAACAALICSISSGVTVTMVLHLG